MNATQILLIVAVLFAVAVVVRYVLSRTTTERPQPAGSGSDVPSQLESLIAERDRLNLIIDDCAYIATGKKKPDETN